MERMYWYCIFEMHFSLNFSFSLFWASLRLLMRRKMFNQNCISLGNIFLMLNKFCKNLKKFTPKDRFQKIIFAFKITLFLSRIHFYFEYYSINTGNIFSRKVFQEIKWNIVFIFSKYSENSLLLFASLINELK